MPARRKKKKPSAKSGRKIQKRRAGKKLSAGAWFEKLVALQARLRAPNGCPWDREQTHLTLRTYLIEEAYEVLEALESADDHKFAEEMGDLLLQVVFHAQIAREEKRFDVSDVIREVHDKMVRRHPHVFGPKRARDAAEVLKNWEQIKAEERRAKGKSSATEEPGKPAAPSSLMDGVSKALPAGLEGFQLTRRASRIGFDWDNIDGVLDKLREETEELRRALASENRAEIEDELGDLLFAAVNVARFLKADPEIALKKANAKFAARFRRMEQLADATGRKLADVPREEMEQLWEAAKATEREAAGAAQRRR